jgi:hypothetical protein
VTQKFFLTRTRVTLTISITLVLIVYLPWADQNVYADPNGTLPFAPEFVAETVIEPRLTISQITGKPIFYIEDLSQIVLGHRSIAELQNGSPAAVLPKEMSFLDTGLASQLLYVPIFAPAGESVQKFSDPDSGLAFTDGRLSAILDFPAPDSPPRARLSASIEELTGQGISAVGVVTASVISSGTWQISSDRYDMEISITLISPTLPIHGYLSVGQAPVIEESPTPNKFSFDIDSNLEPTFGSVILTIEHPALITGDNPVLYRLTSSGDVPIRGVDHQNTDRDTILSTFSLTDIRGSYVLDSPERILEKSPEVIAPKATDSENAPTRVVLLVTLLIGLSALLGLYWQRRRNRTKLAQG